ncbi:hypothetical protein UFOVP995_45, partial [uncultured Caudovirales phage]
AAYYAPRFDYSPTNIGEPRGLLIEGSAINSALYSENINPNSSPQNIYWVVTGGSGASLASVIPVSQTDPANGTTASRCILGTSAVGRVYQGVSTTIGATYTMSFWAKSISGNTALHFWHYNSATGNYTAVTVGTSWARYQITVLARSGGGFVEFGIANLTATAATVDLWGMQVELGSGASSYIVTGASQVTRNADFLFSASSSGAGRSNEFSLDDLAPGISALNEHTVLWTYGRDPNSKREYPASLYARTNANTERIDLRDFSGTTVEVGTQTRTVQSVTVGTASIVKIALAQSTSAYPSSAINGTSATLTSGVIDSALGLQWVQLCNSSAVGISFNPIWARQLKVYPTALTAAQLQTLTTL